MDKNFLFQQQESRRLAQIKNISIFSQSDFTSLSNRSYYNRQPVKVSIIVSLYNYESYITKCLLSAENDFFEEKEIIVVDDASTDKSAEIAAHLTQQMATPTTLLFKKLNTGVSHSRNLGIQRARGKYVFILDADNWIYPTCLTEHFSNIEKANAIACYATVDRFDEMGTLVGRISNEAFSFPRLQRGPYIDAMAMFHSENLQQLGSYRTDLLSVGLGWEDYELWLRIGKLGHPVEFIQQSLSGYSVKEGSLVQQTNLFYRQPLETLLKREYGISTYDL